MDVVAVFTQPDRPAGRGRKATLSPVKAQALEWGLPVYQPGRLTDPDVLPTLASVAPDLMVVVAYGLILPPEVLSIPRQGCVNVHGSLLPRWRGAAPIQRAIEAGDRVTGVSLMRMEAGLDTGPLYARQEVDIDLLETGKTLHDRLAIVGGELLSERLDRLLNGILPVREQDSAGITYAAKLSRQEAWIQWNRTATETAHKIRAFNPWPVAMTTFRGHRVRLWMACEDSDCQGTNEPGEVLAIDREGVVIACAAGAIRVTRLQKDGAKVITARDFCNGYGLSVGERFG